MSDDFEQRLRLQLATSEELRVSEPFGDAVRQRIARLRRARRIVLAMAVVAAGLAVALVGAPLLTTSAMLAAETPSALNGALGALLVSPAGFVLGALTAATALAAAAFSD
jgi:hypothetical protein